MTVLRLRRGELAVLRAAPVLVFLVAACVSGGFGEATYSFLCAAVWLSLAAAASFAHPPRPSPAVIALALFTVLTILSAAWGQPGEALRVAPLPGLYTGLLYGAEWTASASSLRVLRVAIAVAAGAGIVGRATGLAATAPGADSIRMAWPVTYADGLGLVCAMGVLLCLGLRPRWYTGALVSATALIWTFSRSAVAAVVLGGLVLAFRSGRVPRRIATGVVLCLLAAVFVFAHPLVAGFRSPTPDTRDERRLATISGHGRTTLWHAAWQEGSAHPLLGGGAGTWLRSAIAETGRIDLPANAHSLELETFAELGLVGLALILAFQADVLRRWRGEPSALAVFAAWALVAAVDWDWQLPAVTAPALIAAGTLTASRRPLSLRAAPAVGLVALAVGLAAALHMLGAIQLDRGRPTRLLPWDARPWVQVDPSKACRTDPSAPALRAAHIRCP